MYEFSIILHVWLERDGKEDPSNMSPFLLHAMHNRGSAGLPQAETMEAQWIAKAGDEIMGRYLFAKACPVVLA